MDRVNKRSWEHWWEKHALFDFPRRSKWVAGRIITTPTTQSPVRKLIVKEAEACDSSNVLDVGCATCVDYDFFKGTGIKYTGVDITRKFLDYAKKLYPGIDVRLANALSLPFEDGEYDMVYCKSLIEHLHPDEWKDVVIEAWRVANKKLLLSFVLTPRDKPAKYNYMAGGYYNNYLNKTDLIVFLLGLGGVRKVRLMKSDTARSALYVVEKNE